jgi:hypothetical protein
MFGCASFGPVRPVAISDVKAVSGTWEGIVYLSASQRDEIILTVQEDGSYNVVSKTSFGVSSGRGHIVVSDGRILIQDDRGRGAATAFQTPDGDLLIKVDITLSDNSNLSAKLWRRR